MAQKPSIHDDHPHVRLSRDIARLKKVFILVAIFVGSSLAILLLVMAALTVRESQRLRAIEKQAKERAAVVVAQTPNIQESPIRSVVSKLGFSLQYDSSTLTARAQVSDPKRSTDKTNVAEEFSDSQLEQARGYDIVTLQRVPSGADKTKISGPQLTINTSARKDFWANRQSESRYEGMSKIDTLITFITASRADATTTVSQPKQVSINNTSYQKVTVSQDNSRYGIPTPTIDVYYVTIQHGRPFWVHTSDIGSDTTVQAMYDSILASMTYTVPDTSLLGRIPSTVMLTSSKIELPDDTSNVPDSLDDDTLLDVVIRNQPAVVRILTFGCGNVYLHSGAASASFDRTCTGEVGSGSIISGDGYIATNGHVVTLQPEAFMDSILSSRTDLQKLFDYFVEAHIVTQYQADTFLQDLKSGSSRAEKALAKASNLIATNTISMRNMNIHYGVQLSNQPIRIASDGQSISYNDTVVSADLVGMNYDAVNSAATLGGKAQFSHSDVALLKSSGAFPVVRLGDITTLKTGDRLTAIGFPGYVDGNVGTSQWQTIPTITQGSIVSINPDAPGSSRQLIRTTVQIAQGNSGGPSFDSDGKQIGLNTYGMISCPDARCFGDGTIRDIADLKQLMDQNGVRVSSSSISDDWDKALRSYATGDYKTALTLFEKTERQYPANYLAPDLARDARKQLGGKTDISGTSETQSMLVAVLVGVVLAGIGLIVGIIFAHRHLSKKHAHLMPPPPAPPTQAI